MIFRRHLRSASLGFAALVISLPDANAADLVVIEARGIALRPGQIVDSTKPLALKQGQFVTLISPTGATIKLEGPYDRAPEADQGRGLPVANVLAVLVTQRQARVSEVGTTRGTAPNALPDPWLLDASRPGNACLREGEPALFWRPDASRETTLTVMPTDRSWRADTKWPAGSDRISVAAPASIRGGATYLVTLNGVRSAMAIANVPAVLGNDPMRAAWLAGKGCEAQAEALVKITQ